jgi:hypothetical protein
MNRRILCLAIALVVAASPRQASAQIDPTQCPPSTVARPTVVHSKEPGIAGNTWTELNGTVMIVVDGICKWLVSKNADANDLRLYVAGHLLDKSVPTAINLSQDYLKFDLKIDTTNREQWVKVLTAVRDADGYRTNISVGHPPSKEVFVSKEFITFNVYPWYSTYVLYGLVVLLLVLAWFGRRTALLRTTSGIVPASTRPFSLGLVQMAFWFYLVIACYLYIWLVTGEYNTLTEGVLAMTGISAATGLGATMIDGQKRQTVETQRNALISSQTALQSRIAEIAAATPAPGSPLDTELQDKKTQLAKVTADLAVLPALPPPTPSKGFLTDLMSDADGIRFHRFQVVVWTIVLGIVFIRLVYQEFTMPQFSTLLLGLMGLSSGTYVGFKFPEASK